MYDEKKKKTTLVVIKEHPGMKEKRLRFHRPRKEEL